jgi:hypothetical protein
MVVNITILLFIFSGRFIWFGPVVFYSLTLREFSTLNFGVFIVIIILLSIEFSGCQLIAQVIGRINSAF